MVPLPMGKKSSKAVLVFTTVPRRSDATRMGMALVNKRLAACATLISDVQSFYRWKGKLVRGREVLMMLKTTTGRYPALQRAIRASHAYEVPEILGILVDRGHPPYLVWISKEVGN
jgi:periplasmic divalent cation tolerance protein